MKKTRLLTVLAMILFTLSLLFALSSCGGGSEPTELTAPTVTLDGDTARWSADMAADKFEISIDGNLSYIENTVTEKKLADTQSFKIRAVGDGVNTLTSEWSNSVTYTQPEENKTFSVTWMNGETVLEVDAGVAFGTMPTYNGAVPTKADTAEYTYTFVGWSPEVTAVSESVTYYAQFSETIRKYKVTFYDDDGVSVLQRVSVNYGAAAEFSEDAPKKQSCAQYEYTFDKWVTAKGGYIEAELNEITSDVAVYASYTASVRAYTVSFSVNNSMFGTLSSAEISGVAYGTAITVDGGTVTVGDATVSLTLAQDNEYFSYTLVGWSAPDAVTGDTEITANISRTSLRSFSVNFYSADGTLLLYTDLVEYGESAEYEGAEPSEAENDYYSYSFIGWYTDEKGGVAAQLDGITSDLDVYARFDKRAKVLFNVTFVDFDGREIKNEQVAYGESASLPDAPTKQGASFIGWRGNYSHVTSDARIEAVYSDTKNVFRVSDANGSAGETVTVLVEITGNVKICGFDIKIEYDSNALELVGYNGDLDLAVVVNAGVANTVYVNYSGATDRTRQRDIIELTFRIKDGAVGASEIGISVTSAKELSDENIIDTEYAIIGGAVKIND